MIQNCDVMASWSRRHVWCSRITRFSEQCSLNLVMRILKAGVLNSVRNSIVSDLVVHCSHYLMKPYSERTRHRHSWKSFCSWWSLIVWAWNANTGADLCSNTGGTTNPRAGCGCERGDRGLTPSRNGNSRVLPPENFGILYVKRCILGNFCAIIGLQNGSILLVEFTLLRRF